MRIREEYDLLWVSVVRCCLIKYLRRKIWALCITDIYGERIGKASWRIPIVLADVNYFQNILQSSIGFFSSLEVSRSTQSQ